jgi:hypothetical protein
MKPHTTILNITCIALLLGGCGITENHLTGDSTMFARNVYFTLNDASQEQVDTLVAECHRYLKDHPGVVFFAAGTVSPGHDRPVNVRDFDVSLHVIFDSVAAQDAYQMAADHLTFIERNKGNWKQVRVFDSLVD